MKIPSKQDLQQIAINHSSDICILVVSVFKYYEPFTKMYCKSIFFLVNDISLASDNLLRFRCSLLEIILRVIVTSDDFFLSRFSFTNIQDLQGSRGRGKLSL